MGEPLTDADWEVLGRDLPVVLRGLWRAQGLVSAGILSWDDLAQEVAVHMHRLDARGRHYDPERGPLVAYVVQNADLVCMQLHRKHVTRRAHKDMEVRASPPSWALGTYRYDLPPMASLTPTQRAWLDAYSESGDMDAACARAQVTLDEGERLRDQIRGLIQGVHDG